MSAATRCFRYAVVILAIGCCALPYELSSQPVSQTDASDTTQWFPALESTPDVPAFPFLGKAAAGPRVLFYAGEAANGVNGVQDLQHPWASRVSPDGRYLYAGSLVDQSIVVFERNATTGTLTWLQSLKDGVNGVDGLNYPQGVTISADGNHMYVVGGGEHAVVLFTRDSGTGLLTYVEVYKDGVNGVDGLAGAQDVLISPDGLHVYVTASSDRAVAIFSRNSANGRLTWIGQVKNGFNGVSGLEGSVRAAMSRDGKFLYVPGEIDDKLVVFSRNTTTGLLTFVQAYGNDAVIRGVKTICLSKDERFVYTISNLANALGVFQRDPITGMVTLLYYYRSGNATELGGYGMVNSNDIQFSNDYRHVFVPSYNSQNLLVFDQDSVSGALTFHEAWNATANNLTGLRDIWTMALSPDNRHVYVNSYNGVVSIFTTDSTSVDLPPTVAFTVTPDTGTTATQFAVDASGVSDDRTPVDSLRIRWDWENNGAWDTGYTTIKTAIHQFADTGRYVIKLEVMDSSGLTSSITRNIYVADSAYFSAPPTAVFTVSPRVALVNGTFTVNASGVSDVETITDSLQVRWDWNGDGTWDTGYSKTKTATHAYADTNVYAIVCEVRDLDGKTSKYGQPVAVVQGPVSGHALTMIDVDGLYQGTDGLFRFYTVPDLALSPDGRQAYTGHQIYGVSDYRSLVAAFAVDSVNGSLSLFDLHREEAGEGGWNGYPTVVCSPDGKFVYATGYDAGAIAIFTRNDTTGVLQYVSRIQNGVNGITGLDRIDGLIISPDGAHLYAQNHLALTVFSRNSVTGALTQLQDLRNGQNNIQGMSSVNEFTLSGDGKHLYVHSESDGGVVIFSRNTMTGLLTYQSNTREGLAGGGASTFQALIPVSVNDSLLYVANGRGVSSFRRNPATGNLTFSTAYTGVSWIRSLHLGRQYFYVQGYLPSLGYALVVCLPDTVTGGLTPIDTVRNGYLGYGVQSDNFGLRENAEGSTLYAMGKYLSAYQVNAPTSTNTRPNAVFTVAPDTGMVDTTFRIDASGVTDMQEPAGTLQVRWDWESDGAWDTAYSTTKTTTHQYADTGWHAIKMQVRDSAGLLDSTSQTVYVRSTMNVPPTAAFTVIPDSAVADSVFAFNASGVSDTETPVDSLRIRWDWESDGTWDTAFNTTKTATHQYPDTAVVVVWHITLQVMDADSMTAFYVDSVYVLLRRVLQFASESVNGVGGVQNLQQPLNLDVSPDGRHVYAASNTDNSLVVFERNTSTGALTYLQTYTDGVNGVDGLLQAYDVTVSPDGENVYVQSNTEHALVSFARNSATGLLTFLGVLKDGVNGVDGLRSAANSIVSPDGRHVYVTAYSDNSITAFQRSQTDGNLTILQVSKHGVNGVTNMQGPAEPAISPDGRFIYVPSMLNHAVTVFSRDTTAGTLTWLASYQNGVNGVVNMQGATSVSMHSSGAFLYVTAGNSDAVAWFARNTTTGLLTFQSSYYYAAGGYSLDQPMFADFSIDERYFFVGAAQAHNLLVFNVDSTTGQLSFHEGWNATQNGLAGLTAPYGITMSPDNRHLYTGSTGTNARITAFTLIDSAVVNLPPIAAFTVSPDSGTTGTLFTVDASSVSDIETAVGSLQVRWDWESDGAWDTGYSTTKTATHQYAVAGTHHITMEVLDGGGLTTAATDLVVVQPEALPSLMQYTDAVVHGVNGIQNFQRPLEVKVSPDGRHAYVASNVNSSLHVFERNAVNGALTHLATYTDGVGGVDGLYIVSNITISADGNNVYAHSHDEHSIAMFARNNTTGLLTYLGVLKDGTGGVDGLRGASFGAISPDGRHYYITASLDRSIALFNRSQTDGTLTFAQVIKHGTSGVTALTLPMDLDISPDGRFIYVASITDHAVTAFSRDTTSGVLTYVATYKDGVNGVAYLQGPVSVRIHSSGAFLYVCSSTSDAVVLFSRNAATGALTYQTAYSRSVDKLNLDYALFSEFSTDEKYLFVTANLSQSLLAFQCDSVTGQLTPRDSLKASTNNIKSLIGVYTLSVSPDNRHLYTGSQTDSAGVGIFALNSGGTVNLPPVAAFTVSPDTGTVDTLFRVNAAGVSDVETVTDSLQVRWDWESDGAWDTGYTTTKTATHQYADTGAHQIKLQVRDAGGLTTTAVHGVYVRPAPNDPPAATFTVSPRVALVNGTFTVNASGVSDTETITDSLKVRWDWNGDGTWDTGFSTTKTATHAYADTTVYSIRMQVQDSTGNTAVAERNVAVLLGPVTGHGLTLIDTYQEVEDFNFGLPNRRYQFSDVVMTSDGRMVFGGMYSNNNIHGLRVFSRDSLDGTLTLVHSYSPADTVLSGLWGLLALAVSPDGSRLYAAGSGSAAIRVLAVQPGTGVLSVASTVTNGENGITGIASIQQLLMAADGSTLYAVGYSGISSFARNTASGALTQLQSNPDNYPTLASVYEAMLTSDGSQLYAIGSQGAAWFTRDTATGRLTFGNGNILPGEKGSQVRVPTDGRHVYLYHSNGLQIYNRDAADGSLTFNQHFSLNANTTVWSSSEGFYADNRRVYVATYSWPSEGRFALIVCARDTVSGALTPVDTLINGKQTFSTSSFATFLPSPAGENLLIARFELTNYRVDSLSNMNTHPNAAFTVAPDSGAVDTTFRVDASGVTDMQSPAGTLQVRWDWESDGTWDTSYSTTKTATHQYADTGRHTIKMQVKDSQALIDSATHAVYVRFVPNAAPAAVFTVAPKVALVNETFTVDASGVSDAETITDSLQVRWDWNNDGTWDTGFSTTKTATHVFADTNVYAVICEVRDQRGATAKYGQPVAVVQGPVSGHALTMIDVDGLYQGKNGGFLFYSTQNLALSPDNKHAYAGHHTNDVTEDRSLIAAFNVDSVNGSLSCIDLHRESEGGEIGWSGYPTVVCSPDGKFVYATGYYTDAIVIFSRNDTTGALHFVGRIQNGVNGITGLDQIDGLTISPDGAYLYAQSLFSLTSFSRNLTLGTLTQMQDLRNHQNSIEGMNDVEAITLSRDGRHVYVFSSYDAGIVIFSRNISTGQLAYQSNIQEGLSDAGTTLYQALMPISSDDRLLFVAHGQGITAFRRDTSTGNLTLSSVYSDVSVVRSLHLGKQYVYINGYLHSQRQALVVCLPDTITGALTPVDTIRDGQLGYSVNENYNLQENADGKTLYVMGQHLSTYHVNTPSSINTRPNAAFTVAPDTGTTATQFRFDGEGVTDMQDIGAALRVRWDWESDGTWDTNFYHVKQDSHRYAHPGNYTIRMEVTDLGGLTDTVSHRVVVLPTVTLAATPPGLWVIADGDTVTTPHAFGSWMSGSQHTITAPAEQSGATGVRYTSPLWSDGGAISHSITIPNADTTITAGYGTQFFLSTAVDTMGGGLITPSPPGTWADSGTTYPVMALRNTGYLFSGFTGDLTGLDTLQTLIMDEPKSVTAHFGTMPLMTVTSSPDSLRIRIDGTLYTTPAYFTNWSPGETHTLAADTMQSGGTGTRYIFAHWSNGGAQQQTLTVPDSGITISASYRTEYFLTIATNPAGGGDCVPAAPGAWYAADSTATVSVTADSGYVFVGFTGAVTDPDSIVSVVMDDPKTITANFGIGSPVVDWPAHANTGLNMTVSIPNETHVLINGTPIVLGDLISVWSAATGAYGGVVSWSGANTAVAVWGDDPQTADAVDGLGAGELLRWAIHDISTGDSLWARPVYSQGSGAFVANGLAVLDSLVADSSVTHALTLTLEAGWNLVSMNVRPPSLALQNLLNPIADKLVILKNGDGEVYWPEFQIDQIGAWDLLQGYLVNVRESCAMLVLGHSVDLNTTISLNTGWNTITYLPQTGMSPEDAFDAIDHHLTTEIVKDGDGNVYWPKYNIDQIGQLAPGRGYMLYMHQAVDFQYPDPATLGKHTADGRPPLAHPVDPVYFIPPAPTGSNSTLLIEVSGAADGMEIAVLADNRRIVGAGVVTGGRTVMTVWGDDRHTEGVTEGLREGEPYQCILWDPVTRTRSPLQVTIEQGGAEFTNNDIVIASAMSQAAVISDSYYLHSNFPNPFNPETLIPYGLPQAGPVTLEIYDVLGRRVRTLIGGVHQQAGQYQAVWDGRDDHGRSVATGVYLFRLQAGTFTKVRKMALVR